MPVVEPRYSASASIKARTTVEAGSFGVPQLSSRALYTQDGVLPLKYMQLIADCYFKHGGDPVTNPLISPVAASDEVLARFPPVYAHAGSVDPLVDDLLRFGARCAAAAPTNTVHVCLLPKVSHAYMHVSKFLPVAQLAIDMTALWIAEILHVPCDITGVPERMEQMKILTMDLKNYQLTQPKSQAQKDAAHAIALAAGEPKSATVGLLPAVALSSKL